MLRIEIGGPHVSKRLEIRSRPPVSPSVIQYGSSSIAILEDDNGEGEGEDFFTRDGLKLLSNDNYLSDELEDTMDLLLGTTSDSAYQSRRGISERLTVLYNWSEVKKASPRRTEMKGMTGEFMVWIRCATIYYTFAKKHFPSCHYCTMLPDLQKPNSSNDLFQIV